MTGKKLFFMFHTYLPLIQFQCPTGYVFADLTFAGRIEHLKGITV